MKAKIGKQQAAYNAVKNYRQGNPDATLNQAMVVVSKKTKSTTASVRAAYYTHAHRNGDVVAGRTLRNAVTKVAPPKKKTLTTKKTKQASANVDLNVVRISLAKAMDAIQILEDENNKNLEIINGLRHVLNA